MRRDCRWCSRYLGSPAGQSYPARQESPAPEQSSCIRQSGPGERTTGSPGQERWLGRRSGPESWTRSRLAAHTSALQQDQWEAQDSNVSGN